MIVKTHPGFTALYSSHQSNLAGLAEFAGPVSNELVALAVQHSMLLGGAIYWAYTGMDGNPETIFTLEILLPITGDSQEQANLPLKKIPPFRCISDIHNGAWDQLPVTYGKLMQQLQEQGHTMNGLIREWYLNVDFGNAANNITEVQVGIV